MSPIIVGAGSPGSQGVNLTVDSTTIDATNTEFVINDGSTRALLAENYPLPEPQVIWAQPIDADGDIPAHTRYGNRNGCEVRFVIQGSSAADLETTLGEWSQKLAKLNREGGTLLRETPAGTSAYLQVLPSSFAPTFDRRYVKVNRCEVTWQFPAGPFWIGEAVQQSDTTETTLPYVSKTATGPAGDVPALGKLLIDEDQGADQWWLVWGIEDDSLYDVTASSAALFYQAESLTAQGGSSTVAGPSGASGSGSNVMRNTALTTNFISLLSTQATGGGAHLTHVGTFKVYARVQIPATNTGVTTVALEWGVGDFRKFTRNASVTLDATWEGTWRLLDLGLVLIPKVLTGTQRWEGRVLAKSTIVGDDIDVDYLLLIPTSAGWGTVNGVSQVATPTAFIARDEFDQASGNLTGKTAPVGGTWAGAGDASPDWAVDTLSGKTQARRFVTSDSANTGRWVTLDVNQAGVFVQADVAFVNPP